MGKLFKGGARTLRAKQAGRSLWGEELRSMVSPGGHHGGITNGEKPGHSTGAWASACA